MGKNRVSHFQKETTRLKTYFSFSTLALTKFSLIFNILLAFQGAKKVSPLREVKPFVTTRFSSFFKPDEKGAEAPDLVWVELPQASSKEGRG